MSKKIISVFLIFAISLSFFALPVHAAEGKAVTVSSTGSFWQMVANSNNDFMQSLIGTFSNSALGSGTVCPESPDAKHYGSPFGGGRNSSVVLCRCKYCGGTFEVDDSVLEDAYQDYVDALPPGLNSGSSGSTAWGNGFGIWTTSLATSYDSLVRDFWKSVNIYNLFNSADSGFLLTAAFSTNAVTFSSYCGYSLADVSGYDFQRIVPAGLSNLGSTGYTSADFPLGSLVPSTGVQLGSATSGNVFCNREDALQFYLDKKTPVYYLRPDSYIYHGLRDNKYEAWLPGCIYNIGYIDSSGVESVRNLTSDSSFYWYRKSSYSYYQFGFYPLTEDVSFTDPRPGSVSGNWGVMGDDSTVNNIGNQVIVNEDSNTWYNPETGQNEPMESWTYDYATRTYNIVTGDGQTVTVAYGNESLTVNNGDVTYNIYYVNDNSSSQGQCSHKYSFSTVKVPTCKSSGLDQYTCDFCGHSYTQNSSALGHTWKIKQDVNTQYDDTGTLIQEGYTIYECEICGEQYKSTDGSAPPSVNNGGSSGSGSGSGDSSGGGIFDKLGALLGTLGGGLVSAVGKFFEFILDSLIGLAEMLVDKGGKVIDLIFSFFERIPGLFGAFPAFLAAVFPFLPEEFLLILEFGLAAVVFIGIIKWLRK